MSTKADEVISWCSELHCKLENASSENELEPVLRKAFLFMKKRKGLSVVKDGSFKAYKTEEDGDDDRFIYFDGLTEQLRRVFHPIDLNISTGGLATGGSSRGMEIDKNFERLVNGKKIQLTSLHDYTIRASLALKERNLRPFMAQVPVGCEDLMLATALDLVCVCCKTGNLVAVQVKSGFENRTNYTKLSDSLYLQSPFVPHSQITQIADSHFHRHLIQVIAEHLIVQLGHGQPLDHSLLLVVSSDIVTCEPVFEKVTKGIPAEDILINLKRRSDESILDANIRALRQNHAVKMIKKTRRRTSQSKRKPYTFSAGKRNISYNNNNNNNNNNNSNNTRARSIQAQQCPRLSNVSQ